MASNTRTLPVISPSPKAGPTTGSILALDLGTSMGWALRSEEHTSELQSHHDLVCRLLLEKKNLHTLHIMDIELNNNAN